MLDRWAKKRDFGIRRAALLAFLVPLRRGGGDFERFVRHADAMLDLKGFSSERAIGWVLRDTAKKRPTLVYTWLPPRAAARASAVTIREAIHGPPEVKLHIARTRSVAGAALRLYSACGSPTRVGARISAKACTW